MAILRTYFGRFPTLIVAIFALALAMKIIVPAGYMIVQGESGLTMIICPGVEPVADGPAVSVSSGMHDMAAMTKASAGISHAGHEANGGDAQQKMNGPCAFTVLAHASLGGADPVQLALALVFIMALGFVAMVRPEVRQISFLRPPLRGPPLSI